MADSTVEAAPGKGTDTELPAGGKPATGAEKAAEPKGSGNKWTDLGEEIAALGKVEKLGELEPEQVEEKPPAKKPAPKAERRAGEAAEEEPEDEELEPGEEEKEPGEGKESTEGKQPEKGVSRYSVVADGGEEFEFQPLPKGAKIVFNANKQKVEVSSVDELVTLAQQGAALRQVEGTYQHKLATQNKTIATLANRLKAADQAFREIVTDDEKLEEYRARARKLEDPDYKQGLEARRKLEAREAQDAEESERVVEQTSEQFWAEAKNQYEARLEQYPLLDAEDYPDVVQTFWSAFTAHRDALVEDALARAGTEELTKAELEAVDGKALTWLTEDNFEAAMQTLHQKLERRTGRTGGNGKRRAATQEEADAADADRHNKHVDDKLRQRDTKTLRGGKGAPPGPGEKPEKKPTTWAEHMASIHDEFDKARQPSVEE